MYLFHIAVSKCVIGRVITVENTTKLYYAIFSDKNTSEAQVYLVLIKHCLAFRKLGMLSYSITNAPSQRNDKLTRNHRKFSSIKSQLRAVMDVKYFRKIIDRKGIFGILDQYEAFLGISLPHHLSIKLEIFISDFPI